MDIQKEKQKAREFLASVAPSDRFALDVFDGSAWIRITNKNSRMQKLTSMLKRILGKDAQVLYKAGLIDGDLELTESGQKELNGILFGVYRDELVKKAKEIITEGEGKENK